MKNYKVLFVCLGNICRSPAGEGIFKKMVKEQGLDNLITVDSAGTSGYHDGELPDSRMRQHGARRGYKFDSLSRKFTSRDFDNFDIILAMDDNNYRNIMRLAIDLESEKKVYRMTDFSQRYSHDHVPDPYYSGADGFELVLDLLEDACEGLLDKMKNREL
ncbi:protein-tyrosine phosphatase [Dysgonomonas sp. PFB1-18]|uniref:low molecular weight protein-tyrosine-phosphatase n=1 Tax=unclassified Dysgonomonas TaxID=2630389 RepID=UPI002475F2BF|nr:MULTISPECIES: low molecular weight protein-tyrosine-phosphatase [unclassified Dysgonomonas]MDH6307205.1 protein-tyrosine phosphatase [Dysgonomonas sp. PF1-14]MDH6337124.1 protein-tyrosine phosphatase [Dysgonomonas sp. PF1-16]MDH6381110.1 protein-tyrosine phosphatase [Dysgonomonas sp. PFB1-18]MDH6396311.1 protein-tyrosine phosphatase [Dysgonomonas sp. PF1-23]